MGRKQPPKRSDGPGSPLDGKRRALAEEQARIQAEIEHKKRLIEEAPKRAAEAIKRQQEEFVRRASRNDSRFGAPSALHDPRHVHPLNPGAPVRGRKLRKHRRQGMWTFFVLCGIFAGVLAWVYYSVLKPG